MICFQNVSLSLANKPLLDQFQLTVAPGEKIVLATPSGSGKSTLLKLIMGFAQPDQGQVLVNQMEVSPDNLRQIRSQIGYLSQDVDLPNGKVEQVFAEIFNYAGNRHLAYHPDLLKEKALALKLDGDILRKNTADISGGERQRLGWILLMLLDRPILLLDEPTAALDKTMKQYFVDWIAKSKKTVICSSHDPEWQAPSMRIIQNLLP